MGNDDQKPICRFGKLSNDWLLGVGIFGMLHKNCDVLKDFLILVRFRVSIFRIITQESSMGDEELCQDLSIESGSRKEVCRLQLK